MPAVGSKRITLGKSKRKLPKAVPITFSQSTAGVGVPNTALEVLNSTSREPPAATSTLTVPIRTVTVTVCGASTAFGSDTVRIPVLRPVGKPVVLTVTSIAEQVLPTAVSIVRQGRDAPSFAVIHDAEEETVRLSKPSPALNASRLCALVPPAVANASGPIVVLLKRSIGAAFRRELEKRRKPME